MYVSYGALAGATRRIKFGMNVLSLGVRDPLVVAKECATIDYLSDGRLLPAFGVGSPRSPDWALAVGATKVPVNGSMKRWTSCGGCGRVKSSTTMANIFSFVELKSRPYLTKALSLLVWRCKQKRR